MKHPKNVKEAVQIIKKDLSKKEILYISKLKKDDLCELHFSLGMSIRNEFGLWGGNKELLDDCGLIDANTGEPYSGPIGDMASEHIIEKLWKEVRKNGQRKP